MSKKKAPVNFMAGFRQLEKRDAVQRYPQPVPTEIDTKGKTAESQQRSRVGKVAVTQWVDPAVRKQIAQLALDVDKSQAELLSEGLNLLFEKYGKSPIAKP
jgi:hypothetical protein